MRIGFDVILIGTIGLLGISVIVIRLFWNLLGLLLGF